MISGALLLNPEKEITIKKLIKGYLVKYGMVILTFCWGFAAMEEFFDKRTISVSTFTKGFLNMLQGKSWNHMWYMYSLFGVMLFLPVLKLITQHFIESQAKYRLVVGFIFLSIIPCIEVWTRAEFGIEFPMSCIYSFYMLIGYWMDKNWIKLNKYFIAFSIIICSTVLVLDAYIKVEHSKNLGLSVYYSPMIFIYAICIYSIALNKIGDDKEYKPMIEKTIAFLSKHSFGVYIMHMLWINIMYKVVKINPFEYNVVLSQIVLWFAVLVASLVTTMIMKKIPFIKNII